MDVQMVTVEPGLPLWEFARMFRASEKDSEKVKEFKEKFKKAFDGASDLQQMAMFADYTHVLDSTDLDAVIPEIIEAKALQIGHSKGVLSRFATRKVVTGAAPGDPVKISKWQRLTDAAIAEGTEVSGNEFDLTLSTVSISLAERTGAISVNRARYLSRVEIVGVLSQALADWLTFDMERLVKNALEADANVTANYDSNGSTIRPNFKDSDLNITATDILDLDTLKFARLLLTHRQAQAFRPRAISDLTPKKQQVMQGGWDGYYVLVAPPEMIYDLRNDSDYKTAAQQASEFSLGLARFDVVEGIIVVEGDPELFTTAKAHASYAFEVGTAYVFGVDFAALALARTPEGEIITMDGKNDFGRITTKVVSYWGGAGVIDYRNVVRIRAAVTKAI